MRECLKCGVTTPNPKYCSRSCSTTHTNQMYPKRKPEGSCFDCGTTIKTRRKRCTTCRIKHNPKNKRTVGQLRKKEVLKGRHPSWTHHEVRVFNRSWNKELSKQPCRRCGYSLHVELAHKKPISEFSDETLLSVINHPSNVVPLCPNCHWEFDNGYLRVENLS